MCDIKHHLELFVLQGNLTEKWMTKREDFEIYLDVINKIIQTNLLVLLLRDLCIVQPSLWWFFKRPVKCPRSCLE